MELVQIIGNNIRDLMTARSVTITDLANYLNVSRQTLQNYLRGSNIIDSVKLVAVSDFFDVPVESLLQSKSSDSSASFLFRTALNYTLATESISEKVYHCINAYNNLAITLGESTTYFPEQYNLFANIGNDRLLDINFECTDYFSHKLKMTSELKEEIRNIAKDQREKLGLHDTNASAAIAALQNKGIHIFFVDFGISSTNGLSYINDEKGCYIFVNCNASITLERIIFTVFHEYGHILLHRPVYKRKFENCNCKKKSFLDKMADCFAGYFLIPEEYLISYRNTTNFVDYATLFALKQKFQVSLQALVITMHNYNYLSKEFVNRFYETLDQKGLRYTEPASISEQPQVLQYFQSIKNARILSMLQTGVMRKCADVKDIQDILWMNEKEATQILEDMQVLFYHAHTQDWLFD